LRVCEGHIEKKGPDRRCHPEYDGKGGTNQKSVLERGGAERTEGGLGAGANPRERWRE